MIEKVAHLLLEIRKVIHPLTQQGEDRIWRAAEKACALIDDAEAAIEAMPLNVLREALGRIASNGFGHPTRTLDHKRDKEMLAMMDYARAALERVSTDQGVSE